MKLLWELGYALLRGVYWARYLNIAYSVLLLGVVLWGDWCATKGNPSWRKKLKKSQTENGNNITSLPSQESQIYFRLCLVKSLKSSEGAQKKESLRVWNSSCLNCWGILGAAVIERSHYTVIIMMINKNGEIKLQSTRSLHIKQGG